MRDERRAEGRQRLRPAFDRVDEAPRARPCLAHGRREWPRGRERNEAHLRDRRRVESRDPASRLALEREFRPHVSRLRIEPRDGMRIEGRQASDRTANALERHAELRRERHGSARGEGFQRTRDGPSVVVARFELEFEPLAERRRRHARGLERADERETGCRLRDRTAGDRREYRGRFATVAVAVEAADRGLGAAPFADRRPARRELAQEMLCEARSLRLRLVARDIAICGDRSLRSVLEKRILRDFGRGGVVEFARAERKDARVEIEARTGFQPHRDAEPGAGHGRRPVGGG